MCGIYTMVSVFQFPFIANYSKLRSSEPFSARRGRSAEGKGTHQLMGELAMKPTAVQAFPRSSQVHVCGKRDNDWLPSLVTDFWRRYKETFVHRIQEGRSHCKAS